MNYYEQMISNAEYTEALRMQKRTIQLAEPLRRKLLKSIQDESIKFTESDSIRLSAFEDVISDQQIRIDELLRQDDEEEEVDPKPTGPDPRQKGFDKSKSRLFEIDIENYKLIKSVPGITYHDKIIKYLTDNQLPITPENKLVLRTLLLRKSYESDILAQLNTFIRRIKRRGLKSVEDAEQSTQILKGLIDKGTTLQSAAKETLLEPVWALEESLQEALNLLDTLYANYIPFKLNNI